MHAIYICTIKWQVYIKNLSRSIENISFFQLWALYFLHISTCNKLNSHSLFNHSTPIMLLQWTLFKHVELRRRQCRRMLVVILHVVPRCLCLTLASCGRRDRTVLHRKWLHRDTLARGMSAKSLVPEQTS